MISRQSIKSTLIIVDVVFSVIFPAILILLILLAGAIRADGAEPCKCGVGCPCAPRTPLQAPKFPLQAPTAPKTDSTLTPGAKTPQNANNRGEMAFPQNEVGKRVRIAGYWWTTLPDGKYQWCTECNGPYPTGGVPGMILVK